LVGKVEKEILVVDDSQVVVSMLSDMLENLGFKVTGSLSGQDGLLQIDSHKFDMIITDLNMPRMDGVEFTRAAKTHPNCKFVPIVMLSGEDDQYKISSAKKVGISTFLKKPVKESQLKSILQVVLGSSSTSITLKPSKKRILIVDDSTVVLAQLKDDLSADFDIVTAESGEEAIEILEDPVRSDVCFSNDFDLIITDLKMPGISGFELSAYVRDRNKFNKHTPVLLLTTEKISKEEARQNGCMAYFSKSDKQRLLSMVRIIL
jgi:two-component system chemotaxis response regulator CheY